MNEAIAREVLEQELSSWRTKSYSELVECIGRVRSADILGTDNKRYQVEVQMFWDSKKRENVRVLASIDDGGWRAFKPLTESFIITPNGKFISED